MSDSSWSFLPPLVAYSMTIPYKMNDTMMPKKEKASHLQYTNPWSGVNCSASPLEPAIAAGVARAAAALALRVRSGVDGVSALVQRAAARVTRCCCSGLVGGSSVSVHPELVQLQIRRSLL